MHIRAIIEYLVFVAPIFVAISHMINSYSFWNSSLAQKEAANALTLISRTLEKMVETIHDLSLSFKHALSSFFHGQFYNIYRFIPDPIPEQTSYKKDLNNYWLTNSHINSCFLTHSLTI